MSLSLLERAGKIQNTLFPKQLINRMASWLRKPSTHYGAQGVSTECCYWHSVASSNPVGRIDKVLRIYGAHGNGYSVRRSPSLRTGYRFSRAAERWKKREGGGVTPYSVASIHPLSIHPQSARDRSKNLEKCTYVNIGRIPAIHFRKVRSSQVAVGRLRLIIHSCCSGTTEYRLGW